MPPDESNEFFNHLNGPAGQRRPSSSNQKRPATGDFSSVPDPFDESGEHKAAPENARPASDRPTRTVKKSERKRTTRGPGLSPGIPGGQGAAQGPGKPTRSGVVLTPSGVRRVDDDAPPPRKSSVRRVKSTPEPPAGQDDYYEKSRKRTDDGDVGWQEYAAQDFPAMEAAEFGVKVDTTQSGRVVPVGIRKDLTNEAIKNQSIKGAGKRRPRPAKKKKEKKPTGDSRGLIRKIGDSLRLTKPDFEAMQAERSGKSEDPASKGGFERSGSLPSGKAAKRKKTPLGVAWSIFVEVLKILVLVLLLRAYVVQVSQVDGPSMQGTLQQNDRLVVDRLSPLLAGNSDELWLAWLPDFLTPEFERGDIVVIRSPEDPGTELVKRLVGLPGDKLKFEDGRIFVIPAGSETEIELSEPYITADDLMREDGSYRSYREGDLGGAREGEWFEVPVERVFVMGDNRSHSNDSRRWMDIPVNRTEPPGINELWLHESSIEGRVIFRIYPFDRMWPPLK